MSVLDELNIGRRRRLPVIIAAEAAECGLACMAMVGAYHGHDVDLNGLRQRFSLSITGATLRNLMGLADQLGLASRALRVELCTLAKVQTPAVLHWDLNHFVVLKQVKGRTATIHDPARGAVTLSLDEVSKHFTGVALELTPAASFAKVVAREPIRLTSLWSRARGFWSATAQVLMLSAALQIATFAAPFQIQLVVDQAIGRSDRSLLTVLALGFGALVVAQAAIEALRGWALQVFGNLLTLQMVGNLVRHLLRLPSDFFEKRHVGDILSRINSTTAIQDLLTRGVVSALIDGVMALVAAVILFFYAPVLAAVVVTAVALNLAVAMAFYPVMRARTEEQLVTSARERTHIMESVRAATVIKLMGREAEREGAWRNLYSGVINATVSIARFQISATLLQTIVTGVSTVLVVFLGARMILAGAGFSVGMLLAFLSFRQTFSDRAVSLINQAVQFRMIGLHLDRLSDIVTALPEVEAAAPPRLEVRGGISVRGAGFRYGPADPLVLEDIDLEIAPGEFLAITGASGGGKTTLLKLLLGLRAPTTGEIRLDGQPATPELWRGWRDRVGVVSQDDRLLSGTIADNIAFFDPDLDMARVQMAAQAAQVHADIARMPMQYLSLVGDMGSSLSGGQRQRVLLARALYRRPSILILDEGTANLDEATEAVLADLIASLPITRIVVAHRPALVARAHRVLAVEAGRLVAVRANPLHRPAAMAAAE
jgi:ATP-binding cassette subfamily B protein RaxB